MNEDPAVFPPPTERYSIDQLEGLTGVPVRTIRSYIARKLLPEPLGRSRAAGYGPEHLENLRFLQAVRSAVPYELPLALLRRLIETLPREQIARIARGEEAVHAEYLVDVDPALLRRRKRSEEEFDASAPSSTPREAALQPATPRRFVASSAPPEPERDLWTELEVTEDLRLSIRGSTEQSRATLQRLARQLRAWLASERDR